MSATSTGTTTIAATAVTGSARHVVVSSPVGELTIVRDDDGLTGLYFPRHWTRPDRSAFGLRVDPASDRGFDAVLAQLGEYFAGERREFELPRSPQGSGLARQVWQLLTEIPYGQTTTYGALAEQVGQGVDARDIGAFVGHNPLSIIIACHRVVGSTGKLTGYAGGLNRKRQLLELEQAIPPATPTLW
ncbi:MAG: methylated-DNA--[protein]-cysteine S-methyltransferase [Actinomycetota bacterium]